MLSLLDDAPCDVAVVVGDGSPRDGPVLVPFSGFEHDWAAVELGAWLAQALRCPLRLAGPSTGPSGRDASRLLASASLALQRALGVQADPVIVEPSPDGVGQRRTGVGRGGRRPHRALATRGARERPDGARDRCGASRPSWSAADCAPEGCRRGRGRPASRGRSLRRAADHPPTGGGAARRAARRAVARRQRARAGARRSTGRRRESSRTGVSAGAAAPGRRPMRTSEVGVTAWRLRSRRSGPPSRSVRSAGELRRQAAPDRRRTLERREQRPRPRPVAGARDRCAATSGGVPGKRARRGGAGSSASGPGRRRSSRRHRRAPAGAAQQHRVVDQRGPDDDLPRRVPIPARRAASGSRSGRMGLGSEDCDAVDASRARRRRRPPRDRRSRGRAGSSTRPPSAQNSATNASRASPARVPVRRATTAALRQPSCAVGVGGEPGDALPVVTGEPEEVVGRRTRRVTSRGPWTTGDEDHLGIEPRDRPQHDLVGAAAAGDDRVDVLELDQAPNLGGQRAELAQPPCSRGTSSTGARDVRCGDAVRRRARHRSRRRAGPAAARRRRARRPEAGD